MLTSDGYERMGYILYGLFRDTMGIPFSNKQYFDIFCGRLCSFGFCSLKRLCLQVTFGDPSHLLIRLLVR